MNKLNKLKKILKDVPYETLYNCAEYFIMNKDIDAEINILVSQILNTDNYNELLKKIKKLKQKKENLKINAHSKLECITNSKVSLRDYQIKVIKYIMNPINNSLLVVHGTGMGKTLTALTASQCYLNKYPDNYVIVISPASLVGNFEKEMKKYGSTLSSNYLFFSFTKFIGLVNTGGLVDLIDCKNSMIIIDEVHNLKNKKTAGFKSVIQCVIKCHKLLLLTATPFMNCVNDFNAILSMLYRDENFLTKKGISLAKDSKNINKCSITFNKVIPFLRNKISYLNDKNTEDFPRININKIDIPMTFEFYTKLMHEIFEQRVYGYNPDKFYHGYRRAVNNIIEDYMNEKLDYVINIVKKGEQTMIFSNWIEHGINIIIRKLLENDITYDEISGDVNPKNRLEIVENFNRKRYQVLIITRAGGEGLDLKETKNVIILDPVWNPSNLEQIIGRAVRYKSHENLPEEERVVNVYLMVLKVPSHGKLTNMSCEILNISPDSTKNEIRKAYKKLALKYHPDKNRESDTTEKFREIQTAYEHLINSDDVIDDIVKISGDQLLYGILQEKQAALDMVIDIMEDISI